MATLLERPSRLSVLVLLACLGCNPDHGLDAPDSEIAALADALNARRQWTATGLKATASASRELRRAEELFASAIATARDGDLAEARVESRRAAAAYRRVVLRTLESGPVAATERELEERHATLSPEQYERARRTLAGARRLLDRSPDERLELQGLTSAVLSALTSALEGPDTGVAVDPTQPCSAPVQPVIANLSFSAPSPGAVLTRGLIQYVAGPALDVTIDLPRCTFVAQVFLVSALLGGSLELGTDPQHHDPIDGTTSLPYYYTLLSDVIGDDTHRVTLRIQTPDFDDGRAFDVRLVARSASGTLLADASFTMALVRLVNGDARLSLSEAAIQNGFVANQYARYGDDGRDTDAETGVTTFDPSFVDVLRATNAGMLFKWKAKVEVAVLPALGCTPTASAEGRFRLISDGTNVTVTWDVGPAVELSLPPLCELATAVLQSIKDHISVIVQLRVDQSVRARVQTEVNNLVLQAGAFGVGFIQRIETAPDELRVFLNLPADNVVLDVPYGRLRFDEPHRFGLPLNPGDIVMPLAGSLASVCVISGTKPDDCDRKVGAAGLFNWNANDLVPSPWFVSELGTVGYLKFRHEAWKALRGLRRDPMRMPVPNRHPGSAIARLSDVNVMSPARFLGEPCSIQASVSRTERLAFGSNDDKPLGIVEQGSGLVRVTVSWLPAPGLVGLCPTAPVTLPLDAR